MLRLYLKKDGDSGCECGRAAPDRPGESSSVVQVRAL